MGHHCARRALSARLLTAGACAALCLLCLTPAASSQNPPIPQSTPPTRSHRFPPHQLRAQRFLAGRGPTTQPAAQLAAARAQHLHMLANSASNASLTTPWTPLGPNQIASLSYGSVTGRITAVAIDPADTTGNTVYIGTTGGGVWKSTNAAGPAASVRFTPLTDTLPVFNSGGTAIPSLSIGALSVANGIVLAGTGDPNDALDSYYGSGILRSADGGATWTLVQSSSDGVEGLHSFLGLGVAAIAQNSAQSTVVAALSDAAEGTLVNATDDIYSTRGLYYSTDSGATWQMATIEDGSQTVQSPLPYGLNQGGNAATSVVWNPVRQRFFAAVRYHGYYESATGAVWTRLAAQPGAGLTTQNCPTDPGTTGSPTCPIFRGTLAVEPVSGDTFAFTVDASNLDQGIWRDRCAAATGTCASSEPLFATQLNAAPLETSGAILQGDYNLSLAAVASGADTLLFAGTIDLYRCSLAAGCAFRNTTNVDDGCAAPAMVAPAQHAIAVLAAAAPLLYLGNDGGLWRSTDGVNQQGSPCAASDAAHFDNLNPGIGSLAEVVAFSQHPADPDTLIVGVGANGTAATSAASAIAAWPQLAAGEGGFNAIDPASPANRYLSTAPGVSIAFCGKGAACAASDFAGIPAIGPPQTAEDDSLIDPPWLLDPTQTANVAIGTCRVWRGPAASGATWTSAGTGSNAISQQFGGSQASSCGLSNAYIRSLAAGGPASTAAGAASSGSQVLYAGLAGALDGGGTLGGHIFATTAGPSTAWTDLALSPVTNDTADGGVFNPGAFDISSLAIDPHDPTGGTLYATVMGFAGNTISTARLYRTTDAGAHWTNISRNLPNAPANSVVVDPNDANTVYVALDTGVYVTTQVSACATTNCWSVYGTALPNAPVVQLTAAAAMPTGSGTATGELRAATYGRGIWQIPLLTAANPGSPQLAASPASLTFAAQAVGSASPAQTVTLANTGSATLSIGTLSTTGSFAETDACANSQLAPGATCTASVVFTPAAQGTATGVLTIDANVPGGQATVALTGTGAAPAAISLNPLSLNFGTVTVGSTAAAQNIAVSNSGGLTATLQPPTVSGDFQITATTCGGSLAPGVGCTLSIDFTPTAAGIRDGTFSLADSAGTQLASLTGVGASVATDTLSPASLTFPGQLVGTASSAQTVTLTNSGDSALTLIAAQVSAGFTLVDGCGTSLSGHAACSLQVAFAPTASGHLTGSLTVSDAIHSQTQSQTVPLSGIGLAPPGILASPASLTFPGTAVGATSASQTVTLTNSGSGQVTIATIAATGDFTIITNCTGQTLSGSASCGLQIAFSPTATGSRTGVLTLNGSLPNQQATVQLSGTGLAPAAIVLTPASLSFGTVTLGASSAALNLTISNTGGVTATLQTPSVTGDFSLSANTCGATLAPATGCTVAMLFAPTASGARTGTFSLPTSAGVQTAALSGTGASPATDSLSPLTLAFASQIVGTASPAQPVTLTNSGDNPLTLIAVSVSNANFTASVSGSNGCGPTLAGHSTCTIAVASTPTLNGPTAATLTVSDQFRAQTAAQTVALSGTGVAPPGIGLAPASISFPATGIGQAAPAQTLQIANSGTGQLTVTSLAISGAQAADFTESDACAGKTLSGTSTCPVQLTFAPSAAGTRTASLTVFASVAGSSTALQGTAALSGTGLAPAAILLTMPQSAFGTVTVGSSSPPVNITISNTGGVPATLQTPTVTGDFAIQANTCGAALPASTGCTVAIVFTPTAPGTRTGTFSITDSAGTQTASLTGTGASAATDTLSPLTLTFAPQIVATSSATQPVTLTNSGDNALSLIAVSVSGTGFNAANGCGPTLAGHTACTIAVAFTPTAIGAASGTLTVSDQLRSQTVALSGTGLPAPGVSLSPPAGLTFAATGVTTTSTAQTVTLSNQGGSPLAISAIAATGDFSLTTANTCGATLAVGASCTLQVVFAPTAGGTRSGTLSFTDNAPGSPQTLALTGTGVDFTFNSNGPASATISSGQSAVYPLLLSSAAGIPGSAAITCTGAPANATCTVTPATVPLGADATLSATLATGVTTSASLGHAIGRPGIWLALLLPLALWSLNPRPRPRLRPRLKERSQPGPRPRAGAPRPPSAPWQRLLLAFALTASMLLPIACGTGRTIPGDGSGSGGGSVVTPPGTYTITLAASSAGLTRTVTVTLIVN